ncbi:RagB/SusD family nutrient uptake outer membrane protein [Pedobacter petrophilus]|nr:RagB/SusD family nutrient uptake outer membrane protein [Pedobacter petrophilus]
MKNIRILRILGLLIFCSSLMNCKKFLEEKSDSRLVVPQTLADIQGLLDDAGVMNYPVTPSYGETCSDDYFLLPATLNKLPAITLEFYSWKPVNLNFSNDWSKSYLPIYNSNLSIELIKKIPRTTGNALEWDNVKGSALFFRSFYYLALTAQYGLAYDEQTSDKDLGIVIRETSNFNDLSVRSTVKTCYELVIHDLQEAIQLLPNYPKHPLRPSKAAAYALLARAGLYVRDYNLGLKYSELAIKLKPELMDYNGDTDLNALTANVPVKKFNRETIFYTEMLGGLNLHAPVYATIDTNLYASYNINDLRKTAFFRLVAGYPVYKGSYSSNASTLFSGLTTSEQYLTRAECKAFLGDVSGAMNDVNFLLTKRWRKTVPFTPLSASDKSSALSIVRFERRKEMLMRGTRWADIKRQNKEGANITPTRIVNGKLIQLVPSSRFYALPLPADIIDLTGMPQNN